LGRPRIVSEATAEQVNHDQQQARDDATARMAIEGKFGQGKRRFGLGRLMAKLALTSETMMHSSFLVMNVEHLLTRAVCDWLFSWWQGWRRGVRGAACWVPGGSRCRHLSVTIVCRVAWSEGQGVRNSSRELERIRENAFFSKPYLIHEG